MNPSEKILNELLDTIEKNAVDNQVKIEDVNLFLKSWRGELEVYKKESIIPKIQGVEAFQHTELVCSKCYYQGEGKIRAIFSTNKKNQRQVKATSHCRKCDTPLMWYTDVFENLGEEEHRMIIFKNCGIETIEQ